MSRSHAQLLRDNAALQKLVMEIQATWLGRWLVRRIIRRLQREGTP
jgi:predicted DCC family thiol-disulfide oxidoreductase YuxK